MKTLLIKQLLNQPKLINGKLSTIMIVKALKFKKDHTDMFGDLLKFTIMANIKIGVNHEGAINNQKSRESDQPDYKPTMAPTGRAWLYYPILLTDTKTEKKKYLKFEQWNDQIKYNRWYEFKGKRIDDIEDYKPILLASEYRKQSASTETARENRYFIIDMDNIIYIDVNNTRYTREI